ncbi:MAG: flagellar hook-length control protein FliK [Lachnospiraceae bacterium]|nr:flagellar hook-length control protein FliK [Lachnospiraceae bacterium]
MKIGFDVESSKAVKQYTSIPESPSFSKAEKAGAARLDITGMYTDVNAYAVHGRTTEDLKTEAANIDVATARDYMTVMSNTMSGEDYKKAMEDGFDPSDMNPEERETILDHIKAVMAESGQVVAGFNDDLSDEKLKNITGRSIDTDKIKQSLKDADLPDTPDNVKKIGEAVAMMAEIDELTDGSVKYMVENDMAPTVGNIYTSTFSATGDGSRQARGYYGEDMPGYLSRKADNIDWESLKPQVLKTVEQMDIEDMSVEDKLNDAKWLLEKGIPVTEEKIESLNDIRSIAFPVSARTVVAASLVAVAEGKTPKEANLSPSYKSVYKEAYEIKSRLIESSIGREEARLKMSADVNIRLVRSGYSIDTESIEDVISALKDEEKALFAQFLDEDKDGAESGILGGDKVKGDTLDNKIEIFYKTTVAVREIPSMPAALIGRIGTEDNGAFTLSRAHSVGLQYKERYEAAVSTYETVGTEVRKDLGDSITKAFRNVDDILKSFGLDTSEENQRAVRILGYNSMVINEEAIRKVKAADSKLNGLIKALTPGKTLKLIREGVNPMDMDIDELVSHIHETDHDPKREAEKYSRFLYKLEKSGEISDEERASYIGIYRMLNKIERSDHAVIGRMVESEADMTFGSLIRIMRGRGYKLDVNIDDGFGMLSDVIPKGISITEQIETAFKNRLSETEYDRLEAEYLKENMEQIKSAATADDAVYDELLGSGVDITPSNIIAEEQFLSAPNDLFRNLKAYSKRTDRKLSDAGEPSGETERVLTEAMENVAESLNSSQEAESAYKDFANTMSQTLLQMTDLGADSMLDLRSISLMHKQISLAVKQSESEDYHIPVMIDGRLTDIKLKFRHGDEKGLVSAVMDTERFGKVQSQIRLTGERVEVGFIANDRQTLENLRPIADDFAGRLRDLGYDDTDLRFLTGDPGKGIKTKASKADNNIEAVDTKALYNIAKQFIYVIRTLDKH